MANALAAAAPSVARPVPTALELLNDQKWGKIFYEMARGLTRESSSPIFLERDPGFDVPQRSTTISLHTPFFDTLGTLHGATQVAKTREVEGFFKAFGVDVTITHPATVGCSKVTASLYDGVQCDYDQAKIATMRALFDRLCEMRRFIIDKWKLGETRQFLGFRGSDDDQKFRKDAEAAAKGIASTFKPLGINMHLDGAVEFPAWPDGKSLPVSSETDHAGYYQTAHGRVILTGAADAEQVRRVNMRMEELDAQIDGRRR